MLQFPVLEHSSHDSPVRDDTAVYGAREVFCNTSNDDTVGFRLAATVDLAIRQDREFEVGLLC